MSLISLCMIVKNEEKVLDRCLNSVKTLVDEIIIVDTGSTDQTKAIAYRYTDKVYDFQWTNDFSAARNESIRHASGRWILILDADEYVQLDDHEKLRTYLQNYEYNSPCGFVLNIMNLGGNGHDESLITQSTGARIFLNGHSIRYREAIHEQLTSDHGTPSFTPYPFVIYHTGYTAETVKEKNKSERNLSILEAMDTGNKRNDPYFCFVLGNEYSNADREDEALEIYRQSLKYSKPSDTWYFYLLERLVALEMKKGHFVKAHECIEQAINLAPDRTDFLCAKGILLERLGFWNAAEEVFHECIKIASEAEKKNIPYWIIKPSYGKIVPHQSIAEIRFRKGDPTGTVQHWVKTLQLQPKNYVVLQRLIELLLHSQSCTEVMGIVERLYPLDQPVNKMLLYKLALNIGNVDLASHYANQVRGLNIKLDDSDLLKEELLLRKAQTSSALEFPSSSIEDSLAITASIIHNDITHARAALNPNACLAIVEQVISSINDLPIKDDILAQYGEKVAQTLQLLWRYGYSDIYWSLIEKIANKEVLNLMGDWFFKQGLTEQALDLYSVLLENGALNAAGLKNVGLWYINCGNIDEAISFLQASFKEEANTEMIGLFIENTSQDTTKEFGAIYFDRYPDLFQLSTHLK